MKKSEKLYDAITELPPELVEEAGRHKFRRRSVKRWGTAIAAVLAVAIAVTAVARPWDGDSYGGLTACALAEAVYPETAPYPNENSLSFDEDFDAWWEDTRNRQPEKGYADGLEDFWTGSLQTLLGDADGANKVCSPVNVYMALAMLAELTNGESRGQILDALGADSLESLREQANRVWNANYCSDGATTCLLASSLWLNEGVSFRQETLDTLAGNYYASSYQGRMGSRALNEALQSWLNEQTGGLLQEQIGDIELDGQTILALAATVWFQAKWTNEFMPDRTEEDVFHGAAGDATVEYMRQSPNQNYYWGDRFAAVSRGLQNWDGHMWFILPDEGFSPEELLEDGQVLDFIATDGESAESRFLVVNQSIPKFDVSSQFDLEDSLKALGITDVFDPEISDFSPTTGDMEGIRLSEAQHGVRVAIDEEGVTAAAYTVMAAPGGAPAPDEEVDFVLDRPFLIVITGPEGVPLFVGIVNQV